MFNIKFEHEKTLYSKNSELDEMLIPSRKKEMKKADQEGMPKWLSRPLENIEFRLNRVQNHFSIGIASDQD